MPQLPQKFSSLWGETGLRRQRNDADRLIGFRAGDLKGLPQDFNQAFYEGQNKINQLIEYLESGGAPSLFAHIVASLPVGSVSATNVQDAINQLEANKSPTSHTHSDATVGASGFMSAADKAKIDALSDNFKGAYSTEGGFTTANPAGVNGDWGIITVVGGDPQIIAWDTEAAAWVLVTVNIPATNIGHTKTADDFTITSSTGSSTTIPAASATEAGAMKASDRVLIDGLVPAGLVAQSDFAETDNMNVSFIKNKPSFIPAISSVVAVADGAVIPATDGNYFTMTGDTCYLPDTTGLTVGHTLYLAAPTTYAAHQVNWVKGNTVAQLIRSSVRGVVTEQTLYLCPNEILRFTYVGGNLWVYDEIQRGAPPDGYFGSKSSIAVWTYMATSYFVPHMDTITGAGTGLSAHHVYIPWHGTWLVTASQFLLGAAGTPTGYLSYWDSVFGVPTDDMSKDVANFYVADTKTLSIAASRQLRSNDYVAGYIQSDAGSSLQYIPSFGRINLFWLGR